jgi:hypothetical protein
MATGFVLLFCLVMLSIALPMVLMVRLNGGGLFRDYNITVPELDTFAGIEAINHMRYRDNEGWQNPLAGRNHTWLHDPTFILSIHHCLSRALSSEQIEHPYVRLSLCYLQQRGEGAADKKMIDVREFLQDSTTGSIRADIRGIRLNKFQFNSLVQQQNWVNSWFDSNDTSLRQLLNSSIPLPPGEVTSDDWLFPTEEK